MKGIFIDIENTIIDDLWNCNFMLENCEAIIKWLNRGFILTHPNIKCHLFTWGWKERSEINQQIVNNIFSKLMIPESARGFVWTKDDSIKCVFDHKWVNTTNEVELEDLHIPGAMRRFGLEKQTCFIRQVKDLVHFEDMGINTAAADHQFVLIDDTNNPEEKETRIFTNKQNCELEIEFLHPENL